MTTHASNSGDYIHQQAIDIAIEQYESAISDFDEAIRLDLDDAITYHNRGEQKFKMKELSKAKRDFQIALQLAEKAGNADLVGEIKIELDKLESINIGSDSKDK